MEIGNETRIFLFWEYLFRNFGVLSLQCRHASPGEHLTKLAKDCGTLTQCTVKASDNPKKVTGLTSLYLRQFLTNALIKRDHIKIKNIYKIGCAKIR